MCAGTAKCTCKVCVNVHCTLYKIGFQMHVLMEELTANVELNFNKYAERWMKTINNHHVITTHIQSTRLLAELLRAINNTVGCFHSLNNIVYHSLFIILLNVTLFTKKMQFHIFEVESMLSMH